MASFRFDTSHFASAKDMEKKLQRAAFAVVNYYDGRVEAHMKHNAPWTDRTTNARNGLFAKAFKEGGKHFFIVLGHRVDYGIFLEEGTENMAARPIVRPTMDLFGPRVMKAYTRILDRL